MLAALMIAIGALLAAGLVLAAAPLLTHGAGMHPILAAKLALSGGLATLGAAGAAAWGTAAAGPGSTWVSAAIWAVALLLGTAVWLRG